MGVLICELTMSIVTSGFHDCEHAFFVVEEDCSNTHRAARAHCTEQPEKLVCNVWGSGCPKISKISATCTYTDRKGADETKVYYGKLVPN